MQPKPKIPLRILLIGLLLSFLFCYLEWSGNNSGFIFQMEFQIFTMDNKSDSFSHPIIFIPLLGQIFLLISIFQSKPKRKLILASIILLGVLVLLVFLVGILSRNIRIMGSAVPFLCLSVFYIVRYKKF